MKIKDPLTGEVRDKDVTVLNPTEPVHFQNAADYSKHVQAKREQTQHAKGGRTPLGGAPPIPEGKLRPLADAVRALMPKPNFGIPDPEEKPSDWAPQPKPLLQGVGAAYQVNQALSSGELERPISLKEAKGNLPMRDTTVSPETTELLKRQHGMTQTEDPPPQVMESKKEQLVETERELTEGNRKSNDQVTFPDFDSLRSASSPFENLERKRFIEAKLEPMNFSDLITRKEIRQEVTVIPEQFALGFRTVQEKEHMFCLQYLYDKTGTTSAVYTEELYSVLKLTCSVYSVNGAVLPDHRDHVGDANEEVNKEKFNKKLAIILGFPTPVIADIGVQHNWFHDRVGKLFSVDKLKNG